MLIQQLGPIATHLKQGDNSQNSHTRPFSSAKVFVDERPIESDMNDYMKKVFLQTLESNSHVDRVRMNYIKLRKRKSSLNTHPKSSDLFAQQNKVETSLTLTQNAKQSSMGHYLRQLEENSTKTTLPIQIINNKTLCSLYYKLDLLENNLISEHEKLHQINHLNNKSQLHSRFVAQNKLCKDQLQWKDSHQQKLSQLKKTLSNIYQNFSFLKQTLDDNNLVQFEQCDTMKKEYVNKLSNESQENIRMMQNKVERVEQRLRRVGQQYVEKVELQMRRQQIGKQLKQLMCQLQRRELMF